MQANEFGFSSRSLKSTHLAALLMAGMSLYGQMSGLAQGAAGIGGGDHQSASLHQQLTDYSQATLGRRGFSLNSGRNRFASPGAPISNNAVTHWKGSYSYSGTTYEYSMVGTDPHAGSATTVVPTVIIPVRFVFSDGSVYDASTELIDGKTAAQGIIGSPIFQPYDFSAGGTSLGKTQFADAYQRANFWSDVSSRAPDYHVLLGQPTVLPPLTVNVPANELFVYHDDASGINVPIVEVDPSFVITDDFLRQQNVPDNALAIFVTGVAQWTTKGLHGMLPDANGAAARTFIVTSYSPYDLFGEYRIPDIMALSHEIVEWLADPFVTNFTPGWNMVGQSFESCGSSLFYDALEVSDPFIVLGSMHTLSTGVSTFHVVDAAFVDFFTRSVPSRSVNSAYSLFSDATGPSACLGHLPLRNTTTFLYPGSVDTAAFGINNRGDIVGFYLDAQDHHHGFSLIDSHMEPLDIPGATDTFAFKINDAGLIVGYFLDADGNMSGFSLQNGSYQVLNFPGSFGTYAQGVNNQGDIVGGYYDANFSTHGFIFTQGQFSSIDSPLGSMSELDGINGRGISVGYTSDSSFTPVEGFTYDNKNGFLEVAVPYANWTSPIGLNNANVVVGVEHEQRICSCIEGVTGFIAWGSPAARHYRYLLGYTADINDQGQIVGDLLGRGFVATLPPLDRND